jgi:hypothetical protein
LKGLKESSLMNCIYFAHCLENLNTAACCLPKGLQNMRGHIQPGGEKVSNRNNCIGRYFLNGNSGEACGGVDEEEKGYELEEIHQNEIMLDELYTRSTT